MRFLSRLWWFDGNRKQAENFARQAIDVLGNQPPSSAKAMAFSNMSQLKMLSDEPEECLHWGNKAIAMAKELEKKERNIGLTINKVKDMINNDEFKVLPETSINYINMRFRFGAKYALILQLKTKTRNTDRCIMLIFAGQTNPYQ